jgi:hypothetical protein
LNISLLILTRNADLSIFTDNLSNILNESLLFSNGMLFLSRLLQIRDEQLWTKLIDQLAKITQSLLNSNKLTVTPKVQLVEFILQVVLQLLF